MDKVRFSTKIKLAKVKFSNKLEEEHVRSVQTG